LLVLVTVRWITVRFLADAAQRCKAFFDAGFPHSTGVQRAG
jgi:hypothetical protein